MQAILKGIKLEKQKKEQEGGSIRGHRMTSLAIFDVRLFLIVLFTPARKQLYYNTIYSDDAGGWCYLVL